MSSNGAVTDTMISLKRACHCYEYNNTAPVNFLGTVVQTMEGAKLSNDLRSRHIKRHDLLNAYADSTWR